MKFRRGSPQVEHVYKLKLAEGGNLLEFACLFVPVCTRPIPARFPPPSHPRKSIQLDFQQVSPPSCPPSSLPHIPTRFVLNILRISSQSVVCASLHVPLNFSNFASISIVLDQNHDADTLPPTRDT